MDDTDSRVGLASNGIVVLGVLLFAGTVLVGLVASNPVPARIVQSLLPTALSVGLVAYGYRHQDTIGTGEGAVLGKWLVATLLYFVVVGAWFSVLAETFRTSIPLAILTSLVAGVALGAVIGVYALRLRAANAALERTNAELAHSNAELERANDELNAFASIVSHDLRNPLQVAAGSLQLLVDDSNRDDPNVARIEDAHDRIDTIIENVLVLTQRTDAIEDFDRVDVADVAADAWRTTDTEAATLTVDDPPTVDADPDLLATLLENLFGNSVEHGGDTVAVRVGGLDDYSGFYVADDGPGIPPAVHQDVFDLGESGGGGTGIGLFVVGQVADVHDWAYEVTDGETGGARFEFRT